MKPQARRSLALAALAFFVVGYPTCGGSQTAATPLRVALLAPAPPDAPPIVAFREGLEKLGWNLMLDARGVGSDITTLPAVVAEVLQAKPSVIVAASPPVIAAVRKAAPPSLAIVAVDLESDPVSTGLVASLAHPGGNLTGVFLDLPDLAGKWLELLRDVQPRLARVAVLWDPATGSAQLHAVESAARALHIGSRTVRLRNASDVAPAFAEISAGRTQALVILSSPAAYAQRSVLADAATKRRLASISSFAEYSDAGGLLAYGPSLPDLFARAAVFVDRIARGTRPADLPVERPTRFDLVVNARSAKALGLALPPSILMRAGRVIE